jgi:hypothetical protein
VTVASELGARVAWIGPDMGDDVKAGDVILRLDDASIRAERREVEARLSKARADNARAQQLWKEGIMSNEEGERARTDTAVLEAQRDALKVKLDHTVILSPLTGSIATRMVSVGEVVEYGDALYKVVQDDPLKFRTPIPGALAFLHTGQRCASPSPPILTGADREDHPSIPLPKPQLLDHRRSRGAEWRAPGETWLLRGRKIVHDWQSRTVVPETLTTFRCHQAYVVMTGRPRNAAYRGDAS